MLTYAIRNDDAEKKMYMLLVTMAVHETRAMSQKPTILAFNAENEVINSQVVCVLSIKREKDDLIHYIAYFVSLQS